MSAPEIARDEVLKVVQAAPSPVTVEEICAQTGMPSNTVRRHLEVLLATDKVKRERQDRSVPGRPRLLYSPGSGHAELFGHLVEALTHQLTHVGEQAAVEATAAAWAELAPLASPKSTPDEAVEATAEALTQLGFGAEVTPAGDEISLTRCPYAKLIADNPVICDIHGALVAKLLDQSGQPVSVESVDVWARKDLCVVHLSRPDLIPTRTITSVDLLPPTQRASDERNAT